MISFPIRNGQLITKPQRQATSNLVGNITVYLTTQKLPMRIHSFIGKDKASQAKAKLHRRHQGFLGYIKTI